MRILLAKLLYRYNYVYSDLMFGLVDSYENAYVDMLDINFPIGYEYKERPKK